MPSLRTTTPSKGNLNYYRFNYTYEGQNGLNYCIARDNTGWVLPNCTGYCWGAWREMLGEYHNLSRANAEEWYLKKDGYSRGSTPKLGAVACWEDRNNPHTSKTLGGHVAIVIEYGDDWIKVAESDYYSFEFRINTYTYEKGEKYYTKYSIFQGFIYFPEPITDSVTLTLNVSGNGYCTGAGSYAKGTRVTFEAIANDGATFTKWSDGSTSAKRTLTLNSNITLTAYFTGETPTTKHKVTLNVSPDGAGYCTGAGYYEDGEEATLEAIANKGYEFDKWSDGYWEALRYWTITNDLTLTAYFKKKDNLKGTLQDTFIIKALKVLHGDYGNGVTRKKKLGNDYKTVQSIVNYLLAHYNIYNRLAMMCWIGLYGNGVTRKKKLKQEGYNYNLVQLYVKKYNKTKIVVKY